MDETHLPQELVLLLNWQLTAPLTHTHWALWWVSLKSQSPHCLFPSPGRPWECLIALSTMPDTMITEYFRSSSFQASPGSTDCPLWLHVFWDCFLFRETRAGHGSSLHSSTRVNSHHSDMLYGLSSSDITEHYLPMKIDSLSVHIS